MARRKPFGQILREKRIAKGFSLRKFAELVGVSPTYLSQVEQGNADPPTAKRVTKIAALLEEHPDELITLAGRIPEDLSAIIQKQPARIPELLREVRGLSDDQLEQLTQQARRFKANRT